MKNHFMLSKCGQWFFTLCFICNTFYLFILFIYLFIVSPDELAFHLTALPLNPVYTI